MASTKNIYTDDGIWPLQKKFIQMMRYGLYKKKLYRRWNVAFTKKYIQMMRYGLY